LADYPIDYGKALLHDIAVMHRGAEALPGYESWIRDHMGGRVVTFRERLVPSIQCFTELRERRILDFGCGTGSSTVALAEQAIDCRIVGTDVDAASLRIARKRLRFHALRASVQLCQIPFVQHRGDLPFVPRSFDLILLNGVLEHVVPFATRATVLLEVWSLLAPGGLLYINETPNALWPIDRHTTGLPLVPWLPSRMAHQFAVWAGKHKPESNLDARGRRGMTYWEIVRPLRRTGQPFEVLNLTMAGNRLLPAAPPLKRALSARRRLGTRVLEDGPGRLLARLGVPSLALSPWIDHLCLAKPPAATIP
jgi:SAM-dependent methyltransferase